MRRVQFWGFKQAESWIWEDRGFVPEAPRDSGQAFPGRCTEPWAVRLFAWGPTQSGPGESLGKRPVSFGRGSF